VPPKTEKVHWVNPSPGRPRPRARGHRRRHRFCEGRAGARRDEVPPARLGPFPAALLGLPDPGRALRDLRRGAGEEGKPAGRTARDVSFDVPGNPLDRHPTWRDVPCPKCGGRATARDRHDGHLRRFVVVFRALHRAPRRDAHGHGRSGLLDECRSVYRRHRARDPAPALFPLLRPRDAHLRPSARKLRRAVRRALHPRHGDARDLHHPR
jgi:hypothetical protein